MGFEDEPARQQSRLGESLWVAHAAGSKVLEFTRGKSAADFGDSELLQAVVAKMLEIVAGALTELRQMAPEQAARIEHLAAVIDLGAQVSDADKVWSFVEASLPSLVAEVSEQLGDWHQG